MPHRKDAASVDELPPIDHAPEATIDEKSALAIHAALGGNTGPLGDLLRREIELVQQGLESELSETEDGFFVLTPDELHAAIARSAIAGMSLASRAIGTRLGEIRHIEALVETP